MKEFVKLAIVGIAGYLIGFYEYKYKMQKALLNELMSKEKEEEA